jgi:hypothetical protein
MKKPNVSADAAGNVIILSEKNPSQYGHIRVTQVRPVFEENGWVKVKAVSALVPGSIEDLKSLSWIKGQELDGKIIVKEQLTPFNTKEPNRDIKVAGKTGIICVKDGQPIFRKTFYVPNVDAQDTLIEHTNIEDIRAAFIAMEEKEKSQKLDE